MRKFTLSLEEGEVAIPIEGYEGRYVVTTLGRIFSMLSGKFLKGGLSGKGYLTVVLYSAEHSKKTFEIHRLVAIAYIPNPENKPTVNHKNHKRWDNRVENLEWATYPEQQDETCKENKKLAKRNSTAYNRSKPVICFETGEFFWSANEAARAIGKPKGSASIRECCRNLRPTAYGYTWWWASESEIAQHS